jgi:hypothetical protein
MLGNAQGALTWRQISPARQGGLASAHRADRTRGGAIGMAGVLLHAGFKLSDPRLQHLDSGFQLLYGRVLRLDDLDQLRDHLAHDERVCSQLAASNGSPAGRGGEGAMASLIPHPHQRYRPRPRDAARRWPCQSSLCYPDNSSRRALASWRLAVSKPSVNQP